MRFYDVDIKRYVDIKWYRTDNVRNISPIWRRNHPEQSRTTQNNPEQPKNNPEQPGTGHETMN